MLLEKSMILPKRHSYTKTYVSKTICNEFKCKIPKCFGFNTSVQVWIDLATLKHALYTYFFKILKNTILEWKNRIKRLYNRKSNLHEFTVWILIIVLIPKIWILIIVCDQKHYHRKQHSFYRIKWNSTVIDLFLLTSKIISFPRTNRDKNGEKYECRWWVQQFIIFISVLLVYHSGK